MHVRHVVYVRKQLLVELHIQKTAITIYLFIITPLRNVFFCGFSKLNSSRHPTTTT